MRILIDVDTRQATGEHDPAAVVNNVIQALDALKHSADIPRRRDVRNDRGGVIGSVAIMHPE